MRSARPGSTASTPVAVSGPVHVRFAPIRQSCRDTSKVSDVSVPNGTTTAGASALVLTVTGNLFLSADATSYRAVLEPCAPCSYGGALSLD